MVSKKEAARKAVRAALLSWNWRPPDGSERHGDLTDSAPPPSVAPVRTEFSATLFSAEAPEWVRYLRLPLHARYVPGVRVQVHLNREWQLVAFEGENEDSRWLSTLLEQGLRAVRKRAEAKPNVLNAFDDLLFGDLVAASRTVFVYLSPELPTDGAREDTSGSGELRIVLHAELVEYVRNLLEDASLSAEERIGAYWPVVARLLSALAFPSAPIDRFAAKINVFAKLLYVTVNVLYEGKKSGRLLPTPGGMVYERLVADASGVAPELLEERHPYFRVLSTLGFMLRAEAYKHYSDDVRVAAREYLDSGYLRLSLAGAMPPLAAGMQPMSYERRGRKVSTPKPEIGRYGVQDHDDLEAWSRVDHAFRDIGFTLLRQLGIGDFGRVYEALNDHNPRFPERVALKVDRIQGKKKKAILEAEQALTVGRELARANHLIRLYDTGKLRGERFTYHVLQLVDGDTLDNLVGLAGAEHASVSRPPLARLSQRQGEIEARRALSLTGGELWRSGRIALPFAHALSPAMILDLLSSVLLWLDDVHRVDYAINDLKNGNLMISRRGQLKGIDLDSYAPVHTERDKVPDFMFLAVSLVLLLLSAKNMRRIPNLPWEELIESEPQLRAGLQHAWPFGDVGQVSGGRVTHDELMDVLVDLVQRSRRLAYTKHPEWFGQDLVRLIEIKRRLSPEEMVID